MNCIKFIFADIIIFCANCVKTNEEKKFDTIFYFLVQVKSTPRICKGGDIAVILTEKRGAVDIFKIQIKIIF